MVGDLIANCPAMAEPAAAGRLVYSLNFNLRYRTSTWNVDLVSARRRAGTPPPTDGPIRTTSPATVQIAIEIKSVMTEHRKAVKNRKRDLEAHHEHTHNHSALTIAGGVMVINASPTFKSPLRTATTSHKNPRALVRHCVNEMRNVSIRSGRTGHGLDAGTALLLSMDNLDFESTAFVDTDPAPTVEIRCTTTRSSSACATNTGPDSQDRTPLLPESGTDSGLRRAQLARSEGTRLSRVADRSGLR